MIRTMHRYCIALTVMVLSACTVTPHHDASESPAGASTAATLASWNDTASKRSIVDFVTLVTTPESKDFSNRFKSPQERYYWPMPFGGNAIKARCVA